APTTTLALTPTTPAVPVVDLGTAGTVRAGHDVDVRSAAPPPSQARNRSQGMPEATQEPNERDVMWARWDECFLRASSCLKGNAKSRHITRLLIVAYPSTLRIWDTTDLENIVEVLRPPERVETP
ncbi:hypothetical protein H0H92_010866, partial [Tricholoma furcatifolium]